MPTPSDPYMKAIQTITLAAQSLSALAIVVAIAWALHVRDRELWEAREGPRVPAPGEPSVNLAAPAPAPSPAIIGPYVCSRGCTCRGEALCDPNPEGTRLDSPAAAYQCCPGCRCDAGCGCGEPLPNAAGSQSAASTGVMAP